MDEAIVVSWDDETELPTPIATEVIPEFLAFVATVAKDKPVGEFTLWYPSVIKNINFATLLRPAKRFANNETALSIPQVMQVPPLFLVAVLNALVALDFEFVHCKTVTALDEKKTPAMVIPGAPPTAHS